MPSKIYSPPEGLIFAPRWLEDAIRNPPRFIREHRIPFLIVFWIIMLFLWGAAIYVGFVLPIQLPPIAASVSACRLPDVKFYDADLLHYGVWERKEAIKFSLDQVDSSIKYLFVGATAILGYVLKILIEPKIESKAGETRVITTSFVKLLLIHAAIGSIISIACGFHARLFLTMLGDSRLFRSTGS